MTGTRLLALTVGDGSYQMQDNLGTWILGGVVAVLGLAALAVASAAHDEVFYGTGLALFVFCVLFIFVLIHRHVGR